MKKLLITSTDLMMIQFLIPHVKYLSEHGFQVELACSEVGGRLEEVRQAAEGYAQAVHQVRLHRSPVKPGNLKGYRDMKQLLEQNRYDIIWTNEPVMGVVTRLAARKTKCKVIYIAHGFHFYRGASFLHNMVYRSIEQITARFTDVLVTINTEDWQAAKNFRLRNGGLIEHIPGIGVNLDKFRLLKDAERKAVRESLGIQEGEIAVAVVGELNDNKNQQILLHALKHASIPEAKLYLFGKGDKLEALKQLANELGIEDAVRFMGYRKDLHLILPAFDIGASASLREGLGLNLIEEMASGLPLLASDNRGHRDVVEPEAGLLFAANDALDAGEKLLQMCKDVDTRKKMGQHNTVSCNRFSMENAQERLAHIIQQFT